ncbi:hypothetical protein KFL_000580160 [Klebsormidium nitens]|uniref:Uncharacterized protein n=1 Tax=Klebsormidium nitens TaxID=105231 RepID=A0A1Y1HS31_KLENI|nr:hypothetical protein KFL_000580160 [Klebsormidium nitens]|eukprot:GAQ80622.1 hypothetical protein KFL_000580160 [Klebsormidium nitens]
MAAAAAVCRIPATLNSCNSAATASSTSSRQASSYQRCSLLPQLPRKFQAQTARNRCTHHKHFGVARRYGRSVRAMSEEDTTGPPAESTSKTAEELAALEKALGKDKVSTKVRRRRRQSTPERAKPSKPVQTVKKEPSWDEMSPVRKVQELLYGEKGFLFWLNKLAYAAIFGLIGLWILFRFVGPALGLYDLVNPLDVPQ